MRTAQLGLRQIWGASGAHAPKSGNPPQSYTVRPVHIMLHRPFLEPSKFLASSVSLPDLWDQLWSHQNGLSICNSGSCINHNELFLDDDEQCDLETFKTAAAQLRTFASNAQHVLSHHPSYAQPCLVHCDYAFRNVLIDPQTFRVKAFIDWDDMHVMPFVIGVDFPEDIKTFSELGLPPDAEYYREGGFLSFPPNEYSEIVGAVDADGKLTCIDQNGNSTGVDERDTRIKNTRFREEYIKVLETRDFQIAQSDMWTVQRVALKAHCLLMGGGQLWWMKREWLRRQA